MQVKVGTRNGKPKPSVSLDDEVRDAYRTGLRESRKTWYTWIEPVLASLQPLGIALICSVLLNICFGFWLNGLAVHAKDGVVFETIVDPTRTQVLKVIKLGPESLNINQIAEMKMLDAWIVSTFKVPSDAKEAKENKRVARFRVIPGSKAERQIDAYFAKNDPIKLGATETVDVSDKVRPLVGDHHFGVSGTRQAFDLGGKPLGPVTQFNCDVYLQKVMPQDDSQAYYFYPYVFVSDYTCADS